MLRLTSLVPRDVASAVVRAVLDHASTLLLVVDLSATWHASEAGALHATVQQLAAYAQQGLAATDWPGDESASGAIIDVMAALYTCAGSHDIGGGDLDRLTGEADPDTAIGVVLLAAYCRMRLATSPRSGVPVCALAALAGVTREAIHRQDDLRIDRGIVSGADARRWLAARGVAGCR